MQKAENGGGCLKFSFGPGAVSPTKYLRTIFEQTFGYKGLELKNG